MDEIKTKQQVVEKIKESAKILVTVSDNPSVDALSAALGLTLLLDKQEKYATAIFSGETPPAIAFLEPEKTFDDTTDSLRDFIIALNKEKADHLRYKVEGDAVKIFITPYKTTITQDDLEFSQGDYNVELVIALGVDNPESLDKALDNHGQILHDATIITMTAGNQLSNLGGIDWHDGEASSLSEMVTGLAEALKTDKKKSLLDTPIATALLTGIVAETDRFSNEHTTSKVMTVAANLMAAGADQQLIATELKNSHEIGSSETEDSSDTDASSNDGSMSVRKSPEDGLTISHEGETLADLDRRVRGDKESREKVEEELKLARGDSAEGDTPEPSSPEVSRLEPALSESKAAGAYAIDEDTAEPTFGGSLNATTEQAAEDTRREVESEQNKTILSHAYLGGGGSDDKEPGTDSTSAPSAYSSAPGSVSVNDIPESSDVHSAYASEPSVEVPSVPAVEEVTATEPKERIAFGGERVIQPLDPTLGQDAPSAVPSAPSLPPTPADAGLPLPPPLPDFSQINTPPPAIPLPPVQQQPEILGDILSPEPTPAPAMPSPEAPAQEMPITPPAQGTPAPVAPSDPTQFQIPTQP